jgi:hypothetical protein
LRHIKKKKNTKPKKKTKKHTMQAIIPKVDTGIEKYITLYNTAYQNAYEQVIQDLRSDKSARALIEPSDLMRIVAKTMTAVKDYELHTWQKKTLVVEIFKRIVDNMANIVEEEKQKIQKLFFPAINDIFDVVSGICKGHLFFYTKVQAPQPKRLGWKRRDVDVVPVPSVDVEGLIDEIYKSVRTMIVDKPFNINNLVAIGAIIMQVVDQYTNLTGPQKKDIVLQVAHNLVNEAPFDDEAKALVNLAVDTTLSAAIEFIIMAKNGEIEFVNKIEEKIKGCCAQ